MQQDRNNSRRTGQQNNARRQGKPRKAYDWTQDWRPSNQNRRRTQGYQEQTLDFSGGNVTFENHSSGYADNSIQFPQQTARRPNNQNQSRRQGQQSPGGGSAVGKQVGRGIQRRGALPQPYCKARRAAHQGQSGQGKVFSHDWPPKPGDRGVCPGITIQLYITQLENTRAMRAEFPLSRGVGHSLGRP